MPAFITEAKLQYRSQLNLDRMTGNWWHPWDIFVLPQGNGDLHYYAPGEVGLVYAWDPITSTFTSPPGRFDVMATSAGGTWTRTTSDGVQWFFGASGHLLWVRDRHGLQNTLTRDPTNRITSLTDFAGRVVNYIYNAQGYLSSTVDFNGRTTQFAYTSQGYLASITYPPSTFFDRVANATVTRGRTISYQYTTGTGGNLDGNLTAIVDDEGKTAFSAVYDSQDRSTSHTSRGRTWTAQYLGATRVVDPDGVTIDYTFNPNNSIASKKIMTRTGLGLSALRPGEPSFYQWTYARTSNCGCDLITGITRPDGSTLTFTYDAWGNMDSRTVTPAPGGGSPASETWTWSGFTQFCRPLAYVTPEGNAPGATVSDHRTTWTYNGTGDCITATFPKATVNGVLIAPSISMTYTGAGRVATFTDPGGTVTKYTYDPVTHALLQITEDFGTGGLNLITQIGRDLYARPTSVTDPNGKTTNITWNLVHEMTSVTGPQPLAGQVKYLYDNNWALHSAEVENKDSTGTQDSSNPWITSTVAYNMNNQPSAIVLEVDASSTATTSIDYTAAGRPCRVTDPCGGKVETSYDERGLVFTRTEGASTAATGTWQYDYDLKGAMSRIQNPRGYSTNVVSDALGRPLTVTQADGCCDVLTWDLNGNNVRRDSKDSTGLLVQRSEQVFDPYGLKTAGRTYHVNTSGVVGAPETTTFGYDGDLRVESVTNPLSATSTYGYDSQGRLTYAQSPSSDRFEWAYDANGNVIRQTSTDWNQATSSFDVLVLDRTFDSLGRNIGATRRDSGSTITTTTSARYDSRGNLTGFTDELGNTESMTYDARSLLTAVTRDLRSGGTGQGSVVGTIVTQVAYDAAGRVISRTDGTNGVTSFGRDSRGRLVTVTDPANGTRTLGYDTNGNVSSSIDPNGSSTTSTFDCMDRLTARVITRAAGVVGTTLEAVAYDAYGRPSVLTDDDTTVSWTYDDLSHVATATQGSNPLGTTGKTFTYGSNAMGVTTSLTFPDGTVDLLTRDAIQRPSSIATQGGVTHGSYQYAGARVVQISQPNNTTAARTFDALRRSTWTTVTQGAATVARFEYAFDAADHRLFEKRHHASGTGDNYALDSVYRTIQVKTGVADPALELQTPGSQSVTSTIAPSYDAGQGRFAVVVTGAGAGTLNYSSDSLRFYSSVGGVAHVRDANGNLVDDGVRLYEYDYRNQLCGVSDKATSAVIATYKYDATGRRVEKVTSATTLRYVWSGVDMSMVYDSQGLVCRLHRGANRDEILASYQRDVADLNGNSSTTDFVTLTPVYDGAFDCVAVLGPSGSVVERYAHSYDGVVSITDAAGAPLTTSAVGWNQGYGRMWRDEETGLCYARMRYYSPKLGRFITQDPPGSWFDESATGNGYAWLGNRYRNGWDPFGLKTKCPCDQRPKVHFYLDDEVNEKYKSGWGVAATWLSIGIYRAVLVAQETALNNTARHLAQKAQAAGYEIVIYGRKQGKKFLSDTRAALKDKDKAPCFEGIIAAAHGEEGSFYPRDENGEAITYGTGPSGLLGGRDPTDPLEICVVIACQADSPPSGLTWEQASGAPPEGTYVQSGSPNPYNAGAGSDEKFKPGSAR